MGVRGSWREREVGGGVLLLYKNNEVNIESMYRLECLRYSSNTPTQYRHDMPVSCHIIAVAHRNTRDRPR